jgi:Flp pilus assembly protein TadD
VAEAAAGALKLEGLIGCAVAQAEQGQIDDACRCLLEAAELAPGNARPLSGLAEVSLLAGDAMQALSLAVRALEDDPCNANAVAALARAADSLSQNDAFATWRIASCLAPSDPLAASELSRMAAERGDLPHAIWVLERLREFNHELSSDFHVTLAWLCLAAERLGDARVEVEMAHAIDPQSPAVLEVRAHLAQQS